METEYYIYMITREDGERYIGTTNSRRIRARMNSHKRDSRFSGCTFAMEILESSYDEKIHGKEEAYIARYNTFHDGLNRSINGKGNHLNGDKFTTKGMVFSDEHRKKIGIKSKERVIANGGRVTPRGFTFSEETKLRWSKVRKRKCAEKRLKIPSEKIAEVKELYAERPYIETVGKIMRNGRASSYEWEFAKKYSENFGLSPSYIRQVIKGICRSDDMTYV